MKIHEGLKIKPYLARGFFYLGELLANTGRKKEAFKNLKIAEEMCNEMEIGFYPAKIQEVLDRL